MNFLNQILFAGFILTLIIELVLFFMVIVKKKTLLSDKSRKVFESKINILPYIGGLLLTSLLFHFVGEVFELFELMTPYDQIITFLHTGFLFLALLLIAKLTYEMGWGS